MAPMQMEYILNFPFTSLHLPWGRRKEHTLVRPRSSLPPGLPWSPNGGLRKYTLFALEPWGVQPSLFKPAIVSLGQQHPTKLGVCYLSIYLRKNDYGQISKLIEMYTERWELVTIPTIQLKTKPFSDLSIQCCVVFSAWTCLINVLVSLA